MRTLLSALSCLLLLALLAVRIIESVEVAASNDAVSGPSIAGPGDSIGVPGERTALPPSRAGATPLAPATVDLYFLHQRDAQPVPGIIAALINIESGQTTAARSADNGLCGWAGVSPGRYRWELRSNYLVDMTPPPDAVRIDGGAIHADEDLPNLSGEFTVESGQHVVFQIEVLAPGSVFGFTSPGVRVVASHRRDVNGGPMSARLYDQEMSVVAGEDGFFEFESLRPGTKLIRAEWAELPQRFRFATTSLSVVPGGAHDAGRLLPSGGSLAGRVTLRDHLDYSEISAERFGPEFQSEVVIASAGNMPEEGMLLSTLSVTVGREFVIEGLFGGDYTVHYTSAGFGWPSSENMEILQDRPEWRAVFVPATGRVELELPVLIRRL